MLRSNRPPKEAQTKGMRELLIGTAHSRQGHIVYGALDAVQLPSGGYDQFPVIIAQGTQPGPTFWLTAGIHGAEYTGIAVIHRLINADLIKHLHGTVVAIPSLNPAGLRTAQRTPYYLSGQDPNRLFPSFIPKSPTQGEPPPSALESAYKTLFDLIAVNADYLVDLHNFAIGALPFAFRDPVYYYEYRDLAAAQKLQDVVGKLLSAFGHTIVNEFVSADYLKKNLHRSVSGSVLNAARIPSFTVELGGYLTVDPAIVNAAVAGIRNMFRSIGMLNGAPEPIEGIRVLAPPYPMRRILHPFAPASGIIEYKVRSGDPIAIGDPVARLTDIYGAAIGADDGLIRSEYDGYVLGLSIGAACYQGDPLLSMVTRDESSLVLSYPT